MNTAKIIPMHAHPTWDDVREAWGKTQQMGYQSVLQAARVGEMLRELKADPKTGADGVWGLNIKSALGAPNDNAARVQAHALMTLARHLPLLEEHKPESQRAALALIAAQKSPKSTASKQRQPEVFRKGWAQVIVEATGMSERRVHARKKQIESAMGEKMPAYFTDEAEARAFALRYVKAFPEPEIPKPELSETAKQKLDRAIAIETARLQGQFEKAVYAEVDKRIPEITAERQRAIQESNEETARYAHIVKGTKKLITADEYRFLLQVLHPDRAPNDRKEQFSRAFQIVMKLKNYAEA